MRLSQISDRTLIEYGLERTDAREECRAGRMWASSPRDIAVALTEEEAREALVSSSVERVACSALPEEVLDRLGGRAYARRRARQEQLRRERLRPDTVVLVGPLGTRLEISPGEEGGSVEEAVARVLASMPDYRAAEEG